MLTLKAVIIQSFIFLIPHYVKGIDILVETNVGSIKGIKATNGDYTMFLGIPYAKVDTKNPFRVSTPYPVFDKTFEANDDTVKCPQIDEVTKAPTGTLDCLHLNIHVPNSASGENLYPVMLYIHGGFLTSGSGGSDKYGPKFLVKNGVIVVTINYRLGIHGFMCLGTPEVPGNQGLKDQLLAMRWIKANIKSFGGDPDKITLFGQSAGARSVDFQLMAKDENLFSKAILQSANSVSPPGVGEVNTQLPIVVAKHLGLETKDFKEALKFLNTVESNLLVSTVSKNAIAFPPCVEKKLEGVDRFITDYTINRKVSKVKTTPILTGFNNNEKYVAYFSKTSAYYKGLDFFTPFLKKYFTFDNKRLAEMEKIVKQFYIGGEEISIDVRQKLSDFDSDFSYIHPVSRRIDNFMSNGAQKIYYYMFSYSGERNSFKKQNNVNVSGALHTDELGYLFDIKSITETPSPTDQLMIDRMTTMWTNFAKYGDPTPETSDLFPEKWEPVTADNRYYYSIDSELSLKRNPLNQRMAFMDLFFKLNGQFQHGYKTKSSTNNLSDDDI